MNAGKSSLLLQAAKNYELEGMGTLLIKPAVDTRDSTTMIVSRIGISAEASVVGNSCDLFRLFEEESCSRSISCVFVDEAQFLTTSQVHQLCDIVDKHSTPVLCYGLRTDFKGDLFEGSSTLLAMADRLEGLKGMCHCGRKATMVARLDSEGNPITSGEQVLVGGEDKYASYCRKHWKEVTCL